MSALLREIRRALKAEVDATKALQMQAYMKSSMPYHGVPKPRVRELAKPILRAHPVESAEGWRDDVLAIFRGTSHREEWYVALQFTEDRRARKFQDLSALPMYEELIVTSSWWDVVDEVAARRLPELLENEPKAMRRTMLAWSRCDQLWKRRSAILCQLPLKERLDFDFLAQCMEPALDAKEFFLRKAIGWALRQHARVDPERVVAYVDANADRLSPLSRREALKHVG